MLRINHYKPFSNTQGITVYQYYYNFGIFVLVGPSVIIAKTDDMTLLPLETIERSNKPLRGRSADQDFNGDKYCKHVQYHGSLDILLPDSISPCGKSDGGAKLTLRGVFSPSPYESPDVAHLRLGSGSDNYFGGYYSSVCKWDWSGNKLHATIATVDPSTGITWFEEVHDVTFITGLDHNVTVRRHLVVWRLDGKGNRTLQLDDQQDFCYYIGITSRAGVGGVLFFSTTSLPYTPERLKQDLQRVESLIASIQTRMEITPIQCSKTDWDLVSDAMKSISALDSNSLENAIQVPGLRGIGSDFKKIARDILPGGGLVTSIKGVSRAYLINRYVLKTTINDGSEASDAIKNASKSTKSDKDNGKLAELILTTMAEANLLPSSLSKLLKDAENQMSVLNNDYIKRYGTYFDSYGDTCLPFTGSMYTVAKVVFKPQAYTRAQKAWQDLRSWGLDPSLSHLWDLVPFSFAVDWFLKVGDRLSAYEDLMFLTTQYDLIMRSTSNKKTLSYTVDETGSRFSDSQLVGTITVTDYERRIYRSFPAFQPTIDKANPDRHIVEGAALLVQAL